MFEREMVTLNQFIGVNLNWLFCTKKSDLVSQIINKLTESKKTSTCISVDFNFIHVSFPERISSFDQMV